MKEGAVHRARRDWCCAGTVSWDKQTSKKPGIDQGGLLRVGAKAEAGSGIMVQTLTSTANGPGKHIGVMLRLTGKTQTQQWGQSNTSAMAHGARSQAMCRGAVTNPWHGTALLLASAPSPYAWSCSSATKGPKGQIRAVSHTPDKSVSE